MPRATQKTQTEDPRRRILLAARALVVARGHESVSLRAIARRAGYSPASLYEYFDGKASLLRALADEAAARLFVTLGMPGPVDSDLPPLVRIGLAYLRFARESAEDFLLLFARLPSRRRSTAEAPPATSPFALVLAAAREHRKQAGLTFPGGDEELAYAVWGLAHGLAMLQLTHLKGFDADFPRADEAALRGLLDGWSR
jgi:AcrR family transcriptional regulator